MRKGALFLLLLASSLLIIASFPPYNLGVLGWFGLAPLLFAFRQRGFISAATLGLLFGCFFAIGSFSWTYSITVLTFHNFLILLIPFCLYFLVFGLMYRFISRRIGGWIIIGAPALWMTLEYVRSNISFLSFPWNLLGHSQYRYLPVIQIADITGVYGISFLMVMANQFLSQIPDLFLMRREAPSIGGRGQPNRINWVVHTLIVTFALGFTFFYGWYKLTEPDSSKHLRVALVQANIVTRDNMPIDEQLKQLLSYERLTRMAAQRRPDLIVWPSTSLPAPISSRLVRFTLWRIARDTGCYLLVGGSGHEKDRPMKEGDLPFSNSEFLINPSGQIEGQYNKILLLPFNEYLPLQGVIEWPKWITTLGGSFIPGQEYTLFRVSDKRFASPICWENMFPDFFRRFVINGADFITAVTNEGFLGKSPAPYYQSLAIYVFRAVENRITVVRSATTGVSCVIHPNGEIVDRITEGNGKELFISGFLVREIPLSNRKTFYTVYGDVFAYFAMGIIVLILLALVVLRKSHTPPKG